MAQAFRDTGIRSPTQPVGMYVKYLYRGIPTMIGPQAPPISQCGNHTCLTDNGYMAFSHDPEVAKRFSGKRGIVVRLHVNDLPRGTPWVWYTKDQSLQSVRRRRGLNSLGINTSEDEVLLPPGYSLIKDPSQFRKIMDQIRNRNYTDKPYVDVVYIPDPDAKNTLGHHMHRQAVRQRMVDELHQRQRRSRLQ